MWLNFINEDCGECERLSFTVEPRRECKELNNCFLMTWNLPPVSPLWAEVVPGAIRNLYVSAVGIDCWFIVSPSFWEADVGSKLAQCEENYSARAIIRGFHAWKENTSPTEPSSQLLWSSFTQTICAFTAELGLPTLPSWCFLLCFTGLGL